MQRTSYGALFLFAFLIGSIASQSQSAQPGGLFVRRTQFGLVLDHCFQAIAQSLFLLEQRFGAIMRLIRIHAQCWNSLLGTAMQRITAL